MKHFFSKFDTPSLLLTFRGEINPNLIINSVSEILQPPHCPCWFLKSFPNINSKCTPVSSANRHPLHTVYRIHPCSLQLISQVLLLQWPGVPATFPLAFCVTFPPSPSARCSSKGYLFFSLFLLFCPVVSLDPGLQCRQHLSSISAFYILHYIVQEPKWRKANMTLSGSEHRSQKVGTVIDQHAFKAILES